ncbi:putative 1,3-beta-glucan synthase [Helianthus annuus]|nr:putative 1,3-beta-glucan synthase [Helianthus annuus]
MMPGLFVFDDAINFGFISCSHHCKIYYAIDLAIDCKDTQHDIWSRIIRDEYMAYAVQECYYSIEKILLSLVDGEGKLWVERIFREINNSIEENSLVMTLNLKKLHFGAVKIFCINWSSGNFC